MYCFVKFTCNWRILLIVNLFLLPFSGKGQQNSYAIDVTGGVGRLIPHTPVLNPLAGPVSFFNARLIVNTHGKKEWQRLYNYPQYGIGISHNILTERYLGNPTAIYSFINLPFFPVSKLKFNLALHLGVAGGIHPYSNQNPLNIAIGSRMAAYASFNLNTAVRLLPRVDLILLAGGYHYSNGNLNKPNKGINMLGAEAGLRYNLTKTTIQENHEALKPVHKNSSVMVFGAFGWKKENTDGVYYKAGDLNIGFYRTINAKSRLSVGYDQFYDEGVISFTLKDNSLKNVLASGVFVGHELILSNLSIVSQAGLYLYNPHPSETFYYERMGLRYMIGKKLISSLSLVAHNFKIDFIEWGFGFVIWKSK